MLKYELLVRQTDLRHYNRLRTGMQHANLRPLFCTTLMAWAGKWRWRIGEQVIRPNMSLLNEEGPALKFEDDL
jgi:hypothetical protein